MPDVLLTTKFPKVELVPVADETIVWFAVPLNVNVELAVFVRELLLLEKFPPIGILLLFELENPGLILLSMRILKNCRVPVEKLLELPFPKI